MPATAAGVMAPAQATVDSMRERLRMPGICSLFTCCAPTGALASPHSAVTATDRRSVVRMICTSGTPDSLTRSSWRGPIGGKGC